MNKMSFARLSAGVVSICFTSQAWSQSPGAGSEGLPALAATTIDGVTIFGGVRVWANQYEITTIQNILTVDPANPSTPFVRSVPSNNVSQTKLVPIPFVGVRMGSVIASASYYPRTRYDSGDSTLGSITRDEFDLSVGYAVIPSLVVSVGYKRGSQDKLFADAGPTGVKINAGLLGLSASVPLAGKFSLYGNVAYGWGRNKTDFAAISGESSYSSNYRIAELGGSYLAYDGPRTSPLKSIALTVGYRAQILVTKGVQVVTFTLTNPPQVIDLQRRTTAVSTDGFVLGIVGVF